MSKNLSRAVIDALLPDGAIWTVKPDSDLDKLYDGIAQNSEEISSLLASLAYLRISQKTPILADLEKEFGLVTNTRVDEQARRDALKSAKSSRSSGGKYEFLQTKLQEAGFNVTVHVNNPAADPDLFINEGYPVVFNNENALFGRSDAFFGGVTAGEMLVNGKSHPNELTYTVPDEAGYWSLFFFVGGTATRNSTTGALEVISAAQVEVARRDEIKRLILKYKPMHTWVGLIVEFI